MTMKRKPYCAYCLCCRLNVGWHATWQPIYFILWWNRLMRLQFSHMCSVSKLRLSGMLNTLNQNPSKQVDIMISVKLTLFLFFCCNSFGIQNKPVAIQTCLFSPTAIHLAAGFITSKSHPYYQRNNTSLSYISGFEAVLPLIHLGYSCEEMITILLVWKNGVWGWQCCKNSQLPKPLISAWLQKSLVQLMQWTFARPFKRWSSLRVSHGYW